MHRAAAAGHFLSLITGSFLRELNALDSDSDSSEQKNIFTKYSLVKYAFVSLDN